MKTLSKLKVRKIEVKHIPTNYYVGFALGRMYIIDRNRFSYPVVSDYCPHLNFGAGECRDCGLVLEEG